MQAHKILVTVGTTEFDQLIEHTSSEEFTQFIEDIGFKDSPVTYQIGSKGKIVPAKGAHFRLSADIQTVYDEHEIIFTHGGAGTLLCCLTQGNPRKKIVAIANDTLAGNHQIELISQLHEEGYLLGFCSVADLKRNSTQLQAFLKGNVPLKKYQKQTKCELNDLVFGKTE